MKKEITLGQLLSVAMTLLIAILTGWITLSNKVSTHDMKIETLQSQQNRTVIVLDRIETKTELILIKMENKKDR